MAACRIIKKTDRCEAVSAASIGAGDRFETYPPVDKNRRDPFCLGKLFVPRYQIGEAAVDDQAGVVASADAGKAITTPGTGNKLPRCGS